MTTKEFRYSAQSYHVQITTSVNGGFTIINPMGHTLTAGTLEEVCAILRELGLDGADKVPDVEG